MQKLAGHILIIDDNEDVLLTTRIVLKEHFTHITTESNPIMINSLLYDSIFDVILLDINFSVGASSEKEGLYWLDKIKSFSPHSNIVMMTAYGDIDLAVKSMKEGAADFIVKPWDNQKLTATVIAAFNLSQSNKKISALKAKQNMLSSHIDRPYTEMIGNSARMQEVLNTIDKVAKKDANVLILGENGTGKELIARALHRNSNRADQLFVNVDLGTIPETLFEPELFGHIKGAFADANESKAGRFELAKNGTLFLDEIGNLSLPLQAELLAVLQNREVVRMGSNKSIPIDIRLICATNIPTSALKNESKFRQDLLYRINTVEINLPPIRERQDDVPKLANHFLKMFARKYGKENITISKNALHKLRKFSWPGNIRELQHVVERAVIMSDGKTLKPYDFLLEDENIANTGNTLNIQKLEKTAIIKAIKKHRGNLKQAAKNLGLGRTTLYRKMSKYGL